MNSSVSGGRADALSPTDSAHSTKSTTHPELNFSEKRILRGWLVLGLVLPLLSMIPFLYLQGLAFYYKQAFWFLPFSTVVGVLLLYWTCDYRPAGRHRATIAIFVLLCGMGLTVAGIYLYSPGLVHASLVLVTFGWALGSFGGSTWTRILAVCSLFAVSVPLPGGRDEQCSQLLQAVSTWACSGFLDGIGVPNIIEGNVLQIEEKRVEVSEVCGGPDSLFAFVALAIVVVVVRRQSLIVGLLTIASIPLCYVVGNLIRLLAIAIGFKYFDIELASGFGHIAIALIVSAISVACMMLLHVSIVAVCEPIKDVQERNNLTKLYQRVTTWPLASHSSMTADRAVSINSNEAAQGKMMYVILGLPCMVCLVFGAISAYAVFADEVSGRTLALAEGQAAEFPSEDAFPEQFGSLRKVSFSSKTQSGTNLIGKYLHLWKFDEKGNQVLMSLSFPFQGWRPIWTGYQYSGWKVIEVNEVELPSPIQMPWTVEEFSMQNQYGLFAYVWYAFFDQNGMPVSRSSDSNPTGRIDIFSRLQKNAKLERSARLPTSYQVQLYVESGRVLSQAEIDRNRQIFVEAFERIRLKSAPALEKVK